MMIGLGRNPFNRRSRNSTPTPSNNSASGRKSTDSLSSSHTMDSVSNRQHNVATHPVKADPDVAVDEIQRTDSDETLSNSQHLEGLSLTRKQHANRTSTFQATRVIEITRTVRSRVIRELDDVDEDYFKHVDLQSYLEFLADERLIHMPHKGSKWDRVLKAAEFFGIEISSYGHATSHFVPESETISLTALAGCRLLLELGHNNASALESTFAVLWEFGLLLARTLQKPDLFDANDEIKEDLGEIYQGLVGLIGDIAIHYRQRISSMSSEQSISIDFNGVFGKTIDRIWAKREHLINHVWSWKLRSKSYSLTVEQLRSRLSPSDRSIKALLSARLADKSERVEGTCEWIQSHLLDFLRSDDKTFIITGGTGCGKSMLTEWVKERLLRPLGRVTYETLSYTFANDVRSEATSMAFLKSMLSQLFERNVGDVRLYDKLVKSFETHWKHSEKLESALWQAFELGLESVDEQKANMLIVVDGFDEITGHEAASNLHKHLHKLVNKFEHTRVITLSKPVSHLGGAGSKHLVITPEYVHHDIALYFRKTLTRYQHFQAQSHATQDGFVEELVKKAKGSFLWAFLAFKSLASHNSYDSFFKAGQALPDSVYGLLHKMVGQTDLKNTTTKHMLQIMLVAERPLRVGEMEDLLSVNLEKHTITPAVGVRKHIASHCTFFVVERKGLIRFKHSAIRKFFHDEVSGKALLSIHDAHGELTKRMLSYVKHTLMSTNEPSFDIIGGSTVEETFSEHVVLEYIVRNWVGHFRHSKFHGAKGKLELSPDFKQVFPDSTFFSMLEWSCWQNAIESMSNHELTLHIRKECFGEKHRSVMQGMIIVGTIHRSLSHSTEAAKCFYHAFVIGQAILYKFSTVVVACTISFLTCTETIQITTRTELVTYRETMIRFMIEICKTKYGANSDQVIKWYEVLAKLYIDIKEEWRATTVYKELYEITVIRYGKGHPKARGISETLGGLTVILKGNSIGDTEKYDEFVFETADEMEETNDLRISIILRLCKTYESSGKFLLAERLYINLWRRISEICRLKTTIELQITKINIALEYIRFLQRIKRVEEAQSILICLWTEFEHHSCDDRILIIRIKELGVLFKSFGLLTVAVSIFTKVWGWFKSKGKTTDEEAFSTTILITEVVEELETTTTTTKKTTTTTTTVTETVVREIYETHYERCRHGKVDSHFFKACMTLIYLYRSQEKWSECEVVIRRTLELTWKAMLTVDAKITLTGSFTKESILLATQLAVCYHRQRYFEKAEVIYLRIYRACLASFKIDHVHVTEAYTVLIRFYEEYHRHDKIIEIYIELLGGYRKHCGASHHLTIKTLYALGSICMLLGRTDAYQYYIEIVTVLNKDRSHCHHDAFEAAMIVCRYYHDQERWIELRKTCAILWETFVHHYHEFIFTEEMIITLYERYLYVLEFHAKVEFSVIYKISIEYRDTVTKYFKTSSIIIKAMIALAMVCEKHEDHHMEAVTIYEEVIKRTTTVTTTTTTVEETIITTVKTRLSKVYVTIITKGKATSTTTIDRGIAICLEIYEQFKVEFGCWHEKTLVQLRELMILYQKHGKHESTMIRMLQQIVIEVITTVTTSITLYHAAEKIASIYVAVGLAKHGRALLHQLRHLIVLGDDMRGSNEITISLGAYKVTKVTFVFLIAFEQSLIEKISVSYSEVMADILLETYLYEEYLRTLKTETKIEIILEVGAKIRSFWYVRGRKAQCEILDRKLFGIFKERYGKLISTNEDITFIFYASLLLELGKDRSTTDFGHIMCLVSNHKVKALLDAGEFHQAHEVARCSFQLISAQKYYYVMRNVSCGYKLAEYIAGIDVRKASDNKLRESMLETSRKILADVLASCRAANMNFVSLKFGDLAGMVRLLGEQQNYGELELLLLQLWHSREVQKTWSSTTVLSIGRSLVHAHYLTGHINKAVDLCDTICYNLRRSRGWLDEDSLAMSQLLASLYTKTNRLREAMGVHEEILREIEEDGDTATVTAPLVNGQFELLKRDYQRVGGWGSKSEKSYRDLYARLKKRFGNGITVQPMEHWRATTANNDDNVGKYQAPADVDWRLEVDHAKKNGANGVGTVKRPSITKAAARRSGYGSFGMAEWYRGQIVY